MALVGWLADLTTGPFWPAFALVLGLIFGSFANACIHRLPRDQSLWRPRSRCPKCSAPISAWQNIPLVSFVLLRGRCHSCKQPISLRYPVVEALNGVAYVALAVEQGPSVRTLVSMALVTALIVLSVIDLEHRLLPNAITLPGIAIGFAVSFLPGPPSPLASVGAAALGYCGFFLIAEAYRRTRGLEGLGQGDWKMAAMLGAFFGLEKMFLTVLLATIAGTVVGLGLIVFRGQSSRYALPLGTFLGAAGVVTVFVGDALLLWYRGLFHV